jgi:PAS domain S-box-containing protein
MIGRSDAAGRPVLEADGGPPTEPLVEPLDEPPVAARARPAPAEGSAAAGSIEIEPPASPPPRRPRPWRAARDHVGHGRVVAAFEQQVARLFFGTGAVTCAVGAVVLALSEAPVAAPVRVALAVAVSLMAALCAWVGWRLPQLDLRRSVLSVAGLGVALACAVAYGIGEGVHAMAIGFLPMLVSSIAVISGRRPALLLAAGLVVALAALVAAEQAGLIAGAAAVPSSPLWIRVVTLALILAGALAIGLLMAGVVRRSVSDAAHREQRFRVLLDMAADWYWEMDEQHRFVHITERFEGASGVGAASRLGLTPWEIDDLGLGEAQLDAHRADLEARQAFFGLLARRPGPGGATRYVSISGEPRFDPAGRFLGHWGVGRDVTQEVVAQHAMAASEARYRELFARSPSAVLLHRQGRLIDANEAAARLFGYADPRDMFDLALTEHLVPPALRAETEARDQALEALQPGQGVPVVEVALTTRSGQPVIAEITSVRVDTPTGPASMSICFDVTERLEVQAALRRSEALLSSVIAASPDAIALNDLTSGRYLMVSDMFTTLFGYRRDEVIGRTAQELDIWHDPADPHRVVDEVMSLGRSPERVVAVNSKQGQRLLLMVSGAAFEFDGRRYLVTNSRDVSALERSRVEREAILDNASVGIAFTRNDVFELTNRRFEQMLGFGENELLGSTVHAVMPGPEAVEQVRAAACAMLGTHPVYEAELTLRRRDGSTMWCRSVARSIHADDPTSGTIWIAEDITGRRAAQAALAQARDDAQAASRAKSAFLANTSHELRTPLNGLLGLARLALAADWHDPRRQLYLHQIHDSAQSLAAIITDILDLSRIEAGKLVLERQVFDLHGLAESVRQLNQSLADARHLELRLDIEDDVPRYVRGDAVRVRQILANYLANALKFTEVGWVQVGVDRVTVPVEASPTVDGGAPPIVVRLEVLDSGVGIAADQLPRLFRPFSQADESTTRRYGGTGLGLSICRQLAEAMGGRVGVDSEPGRGSRFWAELPLEPVEAEPPNEVRSAAAQQPLPPGRRVLVVEDNPVNMLVTVALLSQWGLDVSEAPDGRKAIEAVQEATARGLPFDLVLMDVQMPVMGGHEATQLLRRDYSAEALPIIALTAAALVSEREAALDAGMNDFVTKPVDPDRLRAAVARHLAVLPISLMGGLGPT